MMRLRNYLEKIQILDEFKSNGFSIIISGRNIKDYLNLNVTSLLDFYPELKEFIVIFDDKSTDGTKEWIKENNLKYMSWKEIIPDKDNITLRVNQIYQESMLQCNTKYLLFLDGDLLFLSDNILYKLFKSVINNKNKISAQYDLTPYSENCSIKYTQENDFLSNTLELSYNKIFHKRLWAGLMFMDLEYFKSKKLYFDNIKDKKTREQYHTLLYGLYDSGTYFFSEILNNNIPYEAFDFLLKYKYNGIFHFGGMSCCVNDKNNNWNKDYYDNNKKILSNIPYIKELFKKCNFNY